MERFTINLNTQISPIEEINSEFTLAKVYVMGLGKNRNFSFFSKDSVIKAMPTLSFIPVVGNLFKDEHGDYHMGGHDFIIDENWDIKPLTVPFGVVKPDTFRFETIEEYGVNVEYLVADVILWTGRFPELKDAIYSENLWFNESMEINANQYRPLESDSNYTEILEYEYSALCLLNKSDDPEKNIEPCFINSKVEPYKFSYDDSFIQKMNELKSEMNKCFNFEKEGEKMQEDTNAVIDETVVETDDAINENNYDTDNSATDSDEATGVYSVSQYQLTAHEKWEKVGAAVDNMSSYTDDTETWYWLQDFDDDYIYVERSIYNCANDEIVRTNGRVKYSSEDDIITITSEFEEMKVMWLTIDEAVVLEEARSNYSSIVKEVEMLRPFKIAAEKAERERAENEIYSKYDALIGEMEEYVSLKEKSNEYSVEELNKECLVLVGTYSLRNKDDASLLSFSLDPDKSESPKKKSVYGDIWEKYGNKNDN